MANCSNCRHYYGKIENYRYFCCVMHPHGLPSTNCPDWEGGGIGNVVNAEIVNEYVSSAPSVPAPDIIHRLIESECKRELRYAKRQKFMAIMSLFIWAAIAFNIFQAVRNSGCQ